MRSVASVVVITTLLFLLIGCSGNAPIKEKNDPMDSTKENVSQGDYIDKEIENKNEDEATEDVEGTEKKDGKKTEKEDAEVIAKSNNEVTSKEKEEILKEIDQMLDEVFDNINQIDDLKDDDLIIED